MALTIVEECRTLDNDGSIKGHFALSDGSQTEFRIYKQYGSWDWQQWGNQYNNEGRTVDRIEQIVNDIVGGYTDV
jgi:hypothetical protein